ncbi:hypothetical protein KBZ18_10175 [Synechococcus sp. Cruz-9H2]|uniref:hypothetical protein n=1 Tax=unclassified Synechococcus TaxID=2626047 RepID=UPI0020CF1BF6|nr:MULTISPECIES: hypothetical protein [unclassified Synechococcus]MCP9819859.1 hypothetical protein [Synechococcus sp. Cruz-9H2]MCP9844075.1 hypothetical protein [Synechococcus sp. Edmonson 11F2]MCP9856289.1 hypothetical protein [Synechococcus sp. Cruz-9C9]MCP9863574.1 hypothetical protein [Synechococcus sp. Cruz-7E5]MCP9870770.1 hypothetical protein [Synechococcus sp. Cruz-7B9]
MVLTSHSFSAGDPVALADAFRVRLMGMLRSYRDRPIPRAWIDVPYGEEEITLLEEELLPVLNQVLARINEIDAELENRHEPGEAA